MKRKITYKTVEIQKLELGRVLATLVGAVTVAIDVAKEAIVAGLADEVGKTHALVRFSHPRQTELFFAMVERIRELGRTVAVVLEPTGTYSTPFVHHMRARGFEVFRVDPKAAHDIAAVLDGVSSQHDAKSCTLIAYLHAQGLSKPWHEQTPQQRKARALVKEHALYSKPAQKLYGQLEAISAACWPELNAMLETRSQWYLHLLLAYPGANAVAAADPEEVRALLRRVSSGLLSSERVEEVLRTSKTTLGAPLDEAEQEYLRALTTELLRLRAGTAMVVKKLRAFVSSAGDEALARVAEVVGPACAVAIFSDLGNPTSYGSAAALEKGCGLNLREKSSGKHQGKLSITKRGSPRVRHLLYMAALRMLLESPAARAWYERRSAYRAGLRKKAVVALMRKIIRALFHVARGSAFDAGKLFDSRVLPPDSPAPHTDPPAAAPVKKSRAGKAMSPTSARSRRSRPVEQNTSSAP
jgi:transposase